MDPIRVRDTLTQLAHIMTPNDANILGKVFGGSLLAMIDLAASATAQRYSGHVCVTASFDRVDFLLPIEIGSLVELEGLITYVGRTSMEVTVTVHATHLPGRDRRQSNIARITMVALADGKPTEVPRLICETREERLAFLEGKLRRELRSQRSAEFEQVAQSLRALSDEKLTHLVNDPSATISKLNTLSPSV